MWGRCGHLGPAVGRLHIWSNTLLWLSGNLCHLWTGSLHFSLALDPSGFKKKKQTVEAGGAFLGDCHPYFLLDILNYFVVQLSWYWLWTLDWKCEMLQTLETFWGAKQCHKWRSEEVDMTMWQAAASAHGIKLLSVYMWHRNEFHVEPCWTHVFIPRIPHCVFVNFKIWKIAEIQTLPVLMFQASEAYPVFSEVTGSLQVGCLWSSSGEWGLASRQCCIYFHSWECHIFL